MTRPTIQGLQDLLKGEVQSSLLGGGVDLPIDTDSGQESLTFTGKKSGDTVTVSASFSGLSLPTFSGFKHIVEQTTISALTKASVKADIGADGSGLQVSIDTKGQTITQIELDVDPHLSSLLGDSSLPDCLTIPSEDVSLTIDPQQKSYTFTCDVSAGEDGWEIVDGFSVTGIGLTVEGTTSASPSVTLEARLSIAGVEVALSAERPSPAADEGGDGEDGSDGPGWKFSGELEEGQSISLATLMEDVNTKVGVPIPSFLSDATINALSLDFETGTKELSLSSDSESLGSLDIEIGVADKRVLCTYHSPSGASVNVKSVVSGISSDLGALVPDLSITLNEAVFVRTGGEDSKLLFGIDIGAGLDLSCLSGLPLVGSALAADQTVKLSYQLLAASDAFTEDEAKELQEKLEDTYSTLPTQIDEGVNVHSLLKAGTATEDADLPLSVDGDDVKADHTQSDEHWLSLQKSFGPVHLEKVGVKYDDGQLWLLLDASMALGGLSVSLDGLGISSPLYPISPAFHLDGMGIAYEKDPIEIGGAFQRREVTSDGTTYVEYDGAAVLQVDLKGQQLNLSAIGSYAYYKDHPSLFLYAFLGYPLGGPPFLFVEGLAAGFGYNRSLTVPDIDGIADFPLVSEAMGESDAPDTSDVANLAASLTGELEKLDDYIAPEVGEGFLAIGVKFSSFKLVDSFVLLTVELGDRFELDLLGLSDLKVPFNVEGVAPLAEIRMVLKASFVPADGFFGLIAALDKSSYILSKSCTLTGGFAVYTWFAGEHGGDFVITLGGYHPDFDVPSHYPTVPRLGFNWQVDDSIVIKGESYFALCSHALMAGGMLDASYKAGKVHASFTVGADFLISWHPYHYDIDAYARISAGLGSLSVDVSADLHVFGPDFGGTAKIKIWIFHVSISFGDQSSTYPAPMAWNAFQGSFLPDANKRCGITVQSGLVRQLKTTLDGASVAMYVVNPKQFALATDAFFPTNAAEFGTSPPADVSYPSFGIRPMGIAAKDLSSEHTITVTYAENAGAREIHCESRFVVTPLRKKAPAGIWADPVVKDGHLLPPSVNEPQFVVSDGLDPVFGFQIVPAAPPTSGVTNSVPRSELQYDTDLLTGFYGWQTLPPFEPSSANDDDRRATLRQTVANNTTRDAILGALGYDPAQAVQIDPVALDASLVIAPQVA